MLDRSKYDPKMITNLEVMTAYFVDLYYNHLYFEGKKLKVNGSVPSITEGYKHALNAFIKSLSNPKLYKKAVIGIHQYFMNYTSFTTISFSKCVDRLSANFVPVDYYNSLGNTQKMSILRLVINQSIKNFTKKLVSDHLTEIIDNHSDADNVRILQDELVDFFLLEREAMYQRFVSSQTKTGTNENVNRLVAEKMQHEIKQLMLEKIRLKKENMMLKHIIIKNNKEMELLRENAGNLELNADELKNEIRDLRLTRHQPSGFRPITRENIDQVFTPHQQFQQHQNSSNQFQQHQNSSNHQHQNSSNQFQQHQNSSNQFQQHQNSSNQFQNSSIHQHQNSSNFDIIEEPESPVSEKSESPANPSQNPSQTQNTEPEQIQEPENPPTPPPATTPSKKGRFAKLTMPKKKKPSSNFGDSVTLDEFF